MEGGLGVFDRLTQMVSSRGFLLVAFLGTGRGDLDLVGWGVGAYAVRHPAERLGKPRRGHFFWKHHLLLVMGRGILRS